MFSKVTPFPALLTARVYSGRFLKPPNGPALRKTNLFNPKRLLWVGNFQGVYRPRGGISR
jgi:hypothetical protein